MSFLASFYALRKTVVLLKFYFIEIIQIKSFYIHRNTNIDIEYIYISTQYNYLCLQLIEPREFAKPQHISIEYSLKIHIIGGSPEDRIRPKISAPDD